MLIEHLLKSKKDNLSATYTNLSFAAIKHLCIMNDVRINKEKIGKFIGEISNVNEDRAYTHEEIGKVLNVCDLRMKMVILLLASTGMRIGALPTLRLGDMIDTRILVYAGSKDKYITLMTPECRQAVDAYHDYRLRSGEKIEPDSPLIREQFDSNDLEQVRKRCKPVTRSTLINTINNCVIKAGLRTINHSSTHRERYPVMTIHGFRKFFTTQLVNSKVNPEIREMLLGHSIGLAKAYYKPTEGEMLAEYEKAIDALTIDPANRLRKKVEKLEVEKNQYDALAAEIEALKRKIK